MPPRRSKAAARDSTDAPFELVTGSAEETQQLGEQIGRLLRASDVVALHGELGSGKTTFVQGLARGLKRDPETIKSPTFVLMREYPGPIPLVHIDGYRLEGPSAVAWLDVDLVLSPRKITVIEWAERFAGLLPEHRLEVRLSHVSVARRRIAVQPVGERAKAIIAQLPAAKAQGDEISGD